MEIAKLQRELETCEAQCLQLEEEAKVAIDELRHKSQEYEHQLEELRNKVRDFEVSDVEVISFLLCMISTYLYKIQGIG